MNAGQRLDVVLLEYIASLGWMLHGSYMPVPLTFSSSHIGKERHRRPC